MSNVQDGLLYTSSHEWILFNGDVATVGVTDHAQDQLGDVVFVELPEIGQEVSRGESFGVIESVKAVSDLNSPLDGEVVEINEDLEEAPEKVNVEPYSGGWCIRVRVADPAAASADLMTAEAYSAYVESDTD